MKLFRLAALSAFFLGCSTGVVSDDDSTDSGTGKDSSVADSGKQDSGGKDASMDSGMDSSTDDAGMDAAMDAMVDANDGSVVLDAQALDGGIASLSGLVLWLDAANGITKNNQSQVSKWADQSGNTNDASQGTQALQPVWNASVINGFPAVHFDMNSTQAMNIADASSLQWGTGDFLVEVVARFDNDAKNNQYGLFYGKLGSSSGVLVIAGDAANNDNGLSGAIDGNNLLGYTSAYNDNAARLYAFRRTGSTLELRVNGAQVTSQAQSGSVDVSASGTDVILGDDGQGQIPLDGDIAEIIAVKGSTSSQDLSSLEAFLKAKYNL